MKNKKKENSYEFFYNFSSIFFNFFYSQVGPTEYGKILGGRGTKPTDKLTKTSMKQPIIEDPLKFLIIKSCIILLNFI